MSGATALRVPLAEVAAEARRPAAAAATLALAAGLCLVALGRRGPTTETWALAPLLLALAWIVVLDVRRRVIPDVVTLPALAYALARSLLLDTPALGAALLGAGLAGGGTLLVVVLARGGLGGGDAKLMALLGAAVGWRHALLALALSQVAAAAVVIALMLVHRRVVRGPVPVGALIALAGASILARG
ncbi:MAG: prepilin peptidase [Candidatus Rokubacteria bacterium]|nr:prepilin peptidase [Candidatus Rokubacteria bacterium]